MAAFSETILNVSQATYSQVKRVAPDEGGLLTGKDPTAFNTADPLRIWIIQVGVIVFTTQLLSLLLRHMRQPRVIAEVLGGILLGPTALGRIPGFTKHIFPSSSLPYLSLVANIGLVLFLFLVGMEIDGNLIKRNARLSASIALGGMVAPFGLGAVFSIAIYNKFVDPSTQFTHFLLFVGVAFSITAFPVLCRILTELKLVDTKVGVVVLSAGVANDIIGWILLALSIALVNAESELTALWVLFACVGWALFLLFPVKMAFLWLAHCTGSIENGPTVFFMTVTMLMVFCSAFFTDVIGVHAIFGGFLGGLIIPRDGGLTIALTEKLEDIVSIVLLPLYFTLSGLSTDLGLLNTGIAWGYTIGIIAIGFIGKFAGCGIMARISGFQWREAASIGTLMSCKGLIELIVLNVGLAAGILNTRVFSMFVFAALFLTFITTPIVVTLYPPRYRQGTVSTVEDRIAEDANLERPLVPDEDGWKTRFTVVLDKMEHLPGIMAITQLFCPFSLEPQKAEAPVKLGVSYSSGRIVSTQTSTTLPVLDALRLIELSDRTSAFLKSSLSDSLIHTDPLLNVFRTFSDLNDVPVSASLSVAPFDELAAKVAEYAKDNLSQLVLVSWLPHTVPINHHPPAHHSTNGDVHLPQFSAPPKAPPTPHSAVDGYFNFGINDQTSSVVHSEFVRGIFARSSVDVALFVDRGRRAGPGHYRKQHICLPFFGGPDDRLALSMVVQLCGNSGTTAKVFRVAKKDLGSENTDTTSTEKLGEELVATALQENGRIVNSVSGFPDTVYGNTSTQTRLQSEIADNILWQSLALPPPFPVSLSPAARAALTRVEFVELSSPTPLRDVLAVVNTETDMAVQRRVRPFVVVGRARRSASSKSYQEELGVLLEGKPEVDVRSEVRKTMGDVATAFVVSGNTAGVVVVQAAGGINR